MRDQRLIALKDPRLRKIRNSLRKIIFLKKADLLENYYIGDNWPARWNIEWPFKASICSCSICGKIDRDMVYDGKSRKWNCVECNMIFITLEKKFDVILP